MWDEVLEYRVWCHPERGAPNEADGSDYYYAFATYEDAVAYFQQIKGAEEPIALLLQREYISEEEPGEYVHVKEERVTEWPVAFLNRPRRTARTIPDFLAPDAPAIGSTSCAGLRRNMQSTKTHRTIADATCVAAPNTY